METKPLIHEPPQYLVTGAKIYGTLAILAGAYIAKDHGFSAGLLTTSGFAVVGGPIASGIERLVKVYKPTQNSTQ